MNSSNIRKTVALVSVLFFLSMGWLLWNERNADHSYIAELFVEDTANITLEVGEVYGTFDEIITFHVDASLLNDYIYTSLSDYSKTISEFDLGNENPFVPELYFEEGDERPVNEMTTTYPSSDDGIDQIPVRVVSVPVI